MLKREEDGAVLRLTLDRPDVRNALDEALIAALREGFESVGSDTRAVVLRGEGKAFCAGGDLGYMQRMGGFTREENIADAESLAKTFLAIERCPAPVIAAVHGGCFGGGCGLAAAADVAVAEIGSTFAFSEVRLGIIPATISPFVVRKIGIGTARRFFVTGEAFDAAEAHRVGLVDHLAPTGHLDDAVNAVVRTLMGNAPRAMREARWLAVDGPLALDECARRLAEARAGDEAKEGLAAFLEKRRAGYRLD